MGPDRRACPPYEIAQWIWASGVATPFHLEVNPILGHARFELGTTSVWRRLQCPSNIAFRITLQLEALRPGSCVRVHNVVVNGAPMTLDLSAPAETSACVVVQALEAVLQGAFRFEGSITLFFSPGPARPRGDQLRSLIFVEAVPAPPEEDADGDGLPDDWERQYFGSPSACAPEGDPDEDGLTNCQEYLAGTDPTDGGSCLRVAIGAGPAPPMRAEPLGRGLVPVLTWQSQSNRTYAIWRAASLTAGASGFVPIAQDLEATPPWNTYTDLSATEAGPYYYRIEVRQP